MEPLHNLYNFIFFGVEKVEWSYKYRFWVLWKYPSYDPPEPKMDFKKCLSVRGQNIEYILAKFAPNFIIWLLYIYANICMRNYFEKFKIQRLFNPPPPQIKNLKFYKITACTILMTFVSKIGLGVLYDVIYNLFHIMVLQTFSSSVQI